MVKDNKTIKKKDSNKIKTTENTKKVKYEKTTKKHLSEMSKFKFDALKLEISIIQRFTENLDVPEVEDIEDLE